MDVPVVLVASDKFKGSLTSRQVATAIAETASACGWRPVVVPVADGGEGTLDAVEQLGFDAVPVTVPGPTGEPVQTRYAVRDGVAVIELADACGLLRLPAGLVPLGASSYGLGVVAAAALRDPAVRAMVVGVGGSASTDGGAGMLAGMGAVLRDGAEPVAFPSASDLAGMVSADLSAVTELIGGRPVTLATDVTNPLLGHRGAVAVFGPQKGLVGADAAAVEAGLTHWADLLAAESGRDPRETPGAGSAGGVGFAALAALGASARSGVELLLELGGLSDARNSANLVITGEGSLDEQSLMGKAVAGVVAAAGTRPVIAVCGQCSLSPSQLEGLGLRAVYALTDAEPDPAEAIRRADELLRATTRRALAEWS